MLRFTSIGAALLLAAASAPVFAQQTAPRNEVPARDASGRQAQGVRHAHTTDRFDSHVADCLILGNQEEIALLKFGIERTKNKDVKELAQSMVKDHEDAISKLRQFASPENANKDLTADQSNSRDVVTREARKVPSADDSSSSRGDTFSRMHHLMRRAHEQCLILNREELTKYEGHHFDEAFLGQQLGAHIGMLATLKAAQEDTSSDLSNLTAQLQETTKKHRDHLDKLMNNLSKEEHAKK